jgi:hypothetical protein
VVPGIGCRNGGFLSTPEPYHDARRVRHCAFVDDFSSDELRRLRFDSRRSPEERRRAEAILARRHTARRGPMPHQRLDARFRLRCALGAVALAAGLGAAPVLDSLAEPAVALPWTVLAVGIAAAGYHVLRGPPRVGVGVAIALGAVALHDAVVRSAPLELYVVVAVGVVSAVVAAVAPVDPRSGGTSIPGLLRAHGWTPVSEGERSRWRIGVAPDEGARVRVRVMVFEWWRFAWRPAFERTLATATELTFDTQGPWRLELAGAAGTEELPILVPLSREPPTGAKLRVFLVDGPRRDEVPPDRWTYDREKNAIVFDPTLDVRDRKTEIRW